MQCSVSELDTIDQGRWAAKGDELAVLRWQKYFKRMKELCSGEKLQSQWEVDGSTKQDGDASWGDDLQRRVCGKEPGGWSRVNVQGANGSVDGMMNWEVMDC